MGAAHRGLGGNVKLKALELYVAAHCNLRCRACNHASPIQKEHLVPPDELARALNHLKRLGITAGRVSLMGGEPTLHPKIDDLCGAARAADIGPVFVVTNGTRLHRMSDAFWNTVDSVMVSKYPGTSVTWPEAFGAKVKVKEMNVFHEMFSFQRNDDPKLVDTIWSTCLVRNAMFGLVGEKLYKCSRAAFLARVLPLERDDGIPLATTTPQQILDYIQDPTPLAACRHCVGSIGAPFRQEQVGRSRFMALQNRPPAEMVARDAETRTPDAPSRKGGGRLRGGDKLAIQVHHLKLPFQSDPEKGWRPHHMFHGHTDGLEDLTCHASILDPGRMPHSPHWHLEEEILVVLADEADLILPDRINMPGGERVRLKTGEFVYYPAGHAHTIMAAGAGPVHYLMFKWRADSWGTTAPLPFTIVSPTFADPTSPEKPLGTQGLLKGPTRWLRRLSCHASRLAPHSGYPSHSDDYDVAILVLEGRLETVGQPLSPNSIVFYPAGVPHDMHNTGDEMASYLVFEFHGVRQKSATGRQSEHRSTKVITKPKLKQRVSPWARMTDRQRWRRRLERWFGHTSTHG